MGATDAIFYIVILVMSVVLHEVAHGFVAEYFGDHTARYAGRLTLNPIKHLDIFGSIILPVLLYVSHAPFLFGWAKPVPYNPDNLRNQKWGTVAVASAGIVVNILIALIFGTLLRYSSALGLPINFDEVVSTIVIMNLALAIFNLVPIPPLDGSKILFSFLPASMNKVMHFMEQYSFVFVVLFVFYFSHLLAPVLTWAFSLVTGIRF